MSNARSWVRVPLYAGAALTALFAIPAAGQEELRIGFIAPKNVEFVKRYRAKYGKVPSYYSEANYTTAQWIDEVLKKTNGKYPGPLPFIKTMSGIKLDAVRGPVSLDDRQTAVNNIYIKKVEKKKMFGYDKEELWNTVIKTYPTVSQFWTYDKQAFLKQPLYSRDFPPCKFCE
jgi:branched-chain amino acid transport system substrate-binding protein